MRPFSRREELLFRNPGALDEFGAAHAARLAGIIKAIFFDPDFAWRAIRALSPIR